MELVLTKPAPDYEVFVGKVHRCGGNVVDIDVLTGIGICDECDTECLTFPENPIPIPVPEVPATALLK